MKKLFVTLSALLVFLLSFSFVGCDDNLNEEKENEWIKVHNVTYTSTRGDDITVETYFKWELESIESSEDEYNQASNDEKIAIAYNFESEKAQRKIKEQISNYNKRKGNTFYVQIYATSNSMYRAYKKVTFIDYTIFYVEIRYNETSLEIKHDGEHFQIPLNNNYIIEHFAE